MVAELPSGSYEASARSFDRVLWLAGVQLRCASSNWRVTSAQLPNFSSQLPSITILELKVPITLTSCLKL